MACLGCAKAKRRCDREVPTCQRCRDRGFHCKYPPPKQNPFVLLELPSFGHTDIFAEESTTLLDSTTEIYLNRDKNTAQAYRAVDDTLLSRRYPDTWSSADWFLSPETWKIGHSPAQLPTEPCTTMLQDYVRLNQEWLKKWTLTGTNPFIHSHLYSARYPSCLQIAYTTLSSYINRTEENTAMILRIVEDRANKLLMDNGIILGGLDQESRIDSRQPVTLLDHLARVHSLIVYASIGLFDGDIRSRHVAEPRCGILYRWLNQMYEFAGENPSRLLFTIDPLDLTPSSAPDSHRLTGSAENIWLAWVMAESVRRTWLTGMGVYHVYFGLQQRWVNCAGGIMFTNSEGLWEAKTASAWKKLCSEKDIIFMERFEAERLFLDSSPSDIDEFGKTMMGITFGANRLESWR
jgi:hypothetical protein